MPIWSDDVILRTVVGQYLTARGVAGAGTITFTPTTTVYDTDSAAVLTSPTTVSLNATGSFSVDLPTTDNPLLSPRGWAYEISIRINGVKPKTIRIFLPAGDGSSVDLFSEIGSLPVSSSGAVTSASGSGSRGPIGPAG